MFISGSCHCHRTAAQRLALIALPPITTISGRAQIQCYSDAKTNSSAQSEPVLHSWKKEVTDKDLKEVRKTQEQIDAEVREKLASHAGDGGAAGVEYEDGKPVAMKRSVQQNMFRYI